MSNSGGSTTTLGNAIEEMYGQRDSSINTGTENSQHDDPLSVLDEKDRIFANEEMLEIAYVPDPDRIVGRDAEIQEVAKRLKSVQTGGSGSSMLLTGKSGSGKTLVTKHVTQAVLRRAAKEGVNLGRVVLDCSQKRTEVQTIKTIANELNDPGQTDISIPVSGIATGSYYDRLWTIINELYDGVILVLDEIDRLTPPANEQNGIPPEEFDDSRVLFQLSRAREEGDIEAGMTVIAISNDLKYGGRLDTRVDSSFSPDEIVFSPYQADQLGDILRQRREAFHNGVLSGDVIPLVSALSAQEHGDARKALDLLRAAGKIARDQDADQVDETHVRQANVEVEVSQVRELLSNVPVTASLAIAAIALLDELSDQSQFESKTVYSVYQRLADQAHHDPVGHRRLTDLLREYETLRLLDFDYQAKGQGRGTHLKIKPLDEPEILLKGVAMEGRIRDKVPLEEEDKNWIGRQVENES